MLATCESDQMGLVSGWGHFIEKPSSLLALGHLLNKLSLRTYNSVLVLCLQGEFSKYMFMKYERIVSMRVKVLKCYGF